MIKAMTLFTILLMTALPVATQKRDQRLEAEIRRVNAEEVESLLRNDVKALERLWSDDLVVTNPLNNFVNKKEVLRLIVSGVLAFRSYDRRIEHIKLHENLAVVAGSETVVWAGKMPGAGKSSLLRFTGLWLRQNGRWQQVARHANIVGEQGVENTQIR